MQLQVTLLEERTCLHNPCILQFADNEGPGRLFSDRLARRFSEESRIQARASMPPSGDERKSRPSGHTPRA